MNSLIDDTEDQDENHYARRSPVRGADREITLGTTMILLIFFALAVQDAAVFGFGFSMGSKHNGATAPAAASPAVSTPFSNFKPAPGNPLGAPASAKQLDMDSTAAPMPKPVEPPPTAKTVEEAAEPSAPAPVVRVTPPPATSATTAAALPSTVAPGPGTVVVQVAALSRQEDADLVANTLRHRGYLVNIRTDTDHLLHVQVGPFATRKDAEAMKARLLADGFNAYIK